MSKGQLKLAFIGAGSVNFGGVDQGSPWNHAKRIDMLSDEFKIDVVGISDVDQARLEFVLKQQREGPAPHVWKNTKLFNNYLTMLEETKPQCVFIGTPPNIHGQIEIDCIKLGIDMFIEKPINNQHPNKVEEIIRTLDEYPNVITSVGYMLRYCKSVDYIKELIKGKTVISTTARYNSAYVSIPKPMWWDLRRSGGPIIEQATHFCDLSRYFGGDINLETVSSVFVSPKDKSGQLSEVPKGCEKDVEDEYKIPRATHAIWKYQENGTIGCLSHALTMKGTRYHTEFEMWLDGMRISLYDPYTDQCVVTVNDEEIPFPDDDPYLTEDRIFLKAVLTRDTSEIKSPYHDAFKTYKLTYKITYPNYVE